MNSFLVYILESQKNGKMYIGSTIDIEERMKRHNSGRSQYTKSSVPWRLVYFEEYASRSEAVRREKQLKSWKSRIKLEELIKKSKYALNCNSVG